MKEEMKFLQVHDYTHKQAKEQAKKNGMSIRSYIKFLLDQDLKKKK